MLQSISSSVDVYRDQHEPDMSIADIYHSMVQATDKSMIIDRSVLNKTDNGLDLTQEAMKRQKKHSRTKIILQEPDDQQVNNQLRPKNATRFGQSPSLTPANIHSTQKIVEDKYKHERKTVCPIDLAQMGSIPDDNFPISERPPVTSTNAPQREVNNLLTSIE